MSLLPLLLLILTGDRFILGEDLTIDEIQSAFKKGTLTSRQLVKHYTNQIETLNPVLRVVTELNPDALTQADKADRERLEAGKCEGPLHGIPVLVKDNIATRDEMNTTAGSLALVGSTVRRDAGVVERLRRAGAVFLGKASMSEWMNFRSFDMPNGWNARGGRGRVCAIFHHLPIWFWENCRRYRLLCF